MATIEIDENIAAAWTLPSAAYTDPALFDRLRERLFARSWHWLADEDAVRVPNAVHPVTLLPGFLDEPLVLTRGGDDSVRCLSNVCTHRGALVVEHPGVTSQLRCRYHGRRFGLDGCFHSMPEFEQAVNFPCERDDLRSVALGSWAGSHYASLDPFASFSQITRELENRVGWLPFEEFTFDASRSRDYLVAANWALYCDNFLEGFHIPFVHSSLNAVLDYGSYECETYPWSSLQVGVSEGGDDVFDLPKDSPDYGREIAAYYFFVFPNLMFNFYPWGLSTNVVQPLSAHRTKVSFRSYVWRPEKISSGAGAELDRVEREDEDVVEAVQFGVRSRLYDRGRYSPTREVCVHHFHRLLAPFLND